jgi:hypothetical protein
MKDGNFSELESIARESHTITKIPRILTNMKLRERKISMTRISSLITILRFAKIILLSHILKTLTHLMTSKDTRNSQSNLKQTLILPIFKLVL